MNTLLPRAFVLAVTLVAFPAVRSIAQDVQTPVATPPPAQSTHGHERRGTVENKTLPNLSDRRDWPEPVSDNAIYRYSLLDLAEFQGARNAPNAFRWDVYGWRGGDVHRFWWKSEGRIATDSSEESEFEAQALYGKLIWPYFDLQAGVRVGQRLREGSGPTRVYAVFGLQGLSPYRFDIEPSVFISHKGQVSARLTASLDLLLSQRLVLQPRLETNLAVQDDEEVGIAAGWNDAELGVRVRYEIRREFAPYVGLIWQDSFAATHRLTTQGGGGPSHFFVVVGARTFF
jgi:copper resistance protein B